MKPKLTATLALTALLGLTLIASCPATAQTYTFTTIAGNAGYGSSDGAGSAARFNGPTGIAVDAAGNLLVTDGNNQTIRKLTLTGTNWVVSTIAGQAGSAGTNNGPGSSARFDHPFGVAVGSAGNVFVTDVHSFTVRKLAPPGSDWVVSTIAGSAGNSGTDNGTNGVARFGAALGAAVDGAGNILVTDTSNHTIRKLTPVGTDWAVTTIAGLAENPGSDNGTNSAALFSSPFGIAVDSSGNAYIADSDNNTIRKLTFVGTNRVVTTIAGLAGSPGDADGTNGVARFNGPAGVAVDTGGNVYVSESGNNRIRKVMPVGTNWVVSTIAGSFGGSADGTNSDAKFFQPYGIAVDTNGIVYVTDSSNNTIRKLTPAGTNWVVTTIAGLAAGNESNVDGTNFNARFGGPYPGAVDAAGNIYVADSGNSTIRKVTRVGADWVVQTIAGFPHVHGANNGTNSDARFFFPYALAAGPGGNLYVADTFNSVIRKMMPEGTNWIVTTIAGLAGFGGSGSADGTNSDAQFNGPFGIAADASGNVFVADTGNNNIRKLTPEGTNWVVTTIAGLAGFGNSGSTDGTNSVARFNSPQGIVAGSGGVVFVADTSNNTLRKLTPQGTNWVVTTIAGFAGDFASTDGTNSDARFAGPAGVAIDSGGNLFVSDGGNATLRKATPSGTNWVVTTIGGMTGVYGNADGAGTNALFSGPNSLVVDSSGRLFIGDNNSIRLGEQPAAPAQGPTLSIIPAGNKVVLFWPDSAADFNLETKSPLTAATWTNLAGAILSGANYWLTNTPVGGEAYFRLHKP